MGRKSNAPQRREQIVRALYELLAVKSYEKVTTKGIAAQADLPPGVIHYYFESMDEIVLVLAEDIIDSNFEKFDTLLSRNKTKKQKTKAIVDFAVEAIFDRHLNRVFYNLIQMAFVREPLHSVIKAMLENYRNRAARGLEEIGIINRNSLSGASFVALVEGFSIQLMVDSKALSKTVVRAILERALIDRLGQDPT